MLLKTFSKVVMEAVDHGFCTWRSPRCSVSTVLHSLAGTPLGATSRGKKAPQEGRAMKFRPTCAACGASWVLKNSGTGYTMGSIPPFETAMMNLRPNAEFGLMVDTI